jgi:hypothetical protein
MRYPDAASIEGSGRASAVREWGVGTREND